MDSNPVEENTFEEKDLEEEEGEFEEEDEEVNPDNLAQDKPRLKPKKPKVKTNKVVFTHPFLQYEQDELLNPIIQIVKSLLTPKPDTKGLEEKAKQLKWYLFKIIFENKSTSDLKKEFKKLGLSNKTTCGELIAEDTLCFRCLDCEKPSIDDSLTSLLCVPCFEKSVHKGHRIVIIELTSDNPGFCDCGDEDMLVPESFCPDHQHTEVNVEEILNKFPRDIVKKGKQVLSKAFYAAIAILEIAKTMKAGPSYQALIKFGHLFFDQILSFAETGYTDISSSLLLLLNSILQSQFQDPFNQVWHNCDNHDALLDKDIHLNEPHTCKCSIMGAIFRFVKLIEIGEQPKIQKVLMECLRDLNFKYFLSVELTKYVQFLYPQALIKDSLGYNANSKLLGMNLAITGSERFVRAVLESGYFLNYLTVIKNTMEIYTSIKSGLLDVTATMEDIFSWYVNPSYREAVNNLIVNTDFIKNLMQILQSFEQKFLCPPIVFSFIEDSIDYQYMEDVMMVDKRVSEGIEYCLEYISRCPKDQKISLLRGVCQEWYKNFKALNTDSDHSSLSLTPTLERVFFYLLRAYDYELSLETLQNFFKDCLPGVDSRELAKSLISQILKVLGKLRYIQNVHNPTIDKLGEGYYRFSCVFFELDISLIQALVMLIEPSQVYEILVKNFFSYDPVLSDFMINPVDITEPLLKLKIIVITDFLNLLVYLMSDELCLFNVNTSFYLQEELDKDKNRERIVEKALVNLLISQYWVDVANVKDSLQKRCVIINDNTHLNSILSKITEHDEETHKIRIKDGYETQLDPFLFYKTPIIQQDIINRVLSKSERHQKPDLVSGKTYNNLQGYLKTAQLQLYQSDLTQKLIVLIAHIAKLSYPLLRPALKLVLLNLEVAQKNQVLLKKIQENYLSSQEFLEKLLDLPKQQELKDCDSIIQKILSLLKTLFPDSKALITPSDTENSEAKNPSESDKKKAALEKMAKLKEEFAKRQALFADKHKDLISESLKNPAAEETKADEVVVEKKDLTCQYCLVKINQAEEQYGVPLNITFTNNFYDINQHHLPCQPQDYSDIANVSWWPVLQSCHHHYHKKCFGNLFLNCKNSEEYSSEFLKTPYESYCALCKTLCNSFLAINPEVPETTAEVIPPPVASSDDQPPNPQDEFFKNQLKWTFAQRITEIFKFAISSLDDQILINPELAPKAPLDLIVERAYDYFLNSLHFHKKPESFEKSFALYSCFFKAFSFEGGAPQLLLQSIPVKETQALLEFQPENLLNITLLNALKANNSSLESIMKIIQDYLTFKVLQSITLENFESPLTPKECLPLFTNDVIRNQITKELLFPLQKIALAYYFNSHIQSKTSHNLSGLSTVICTAAADSSFASFDKLLQAVNIPYTLEALISKCSNEFEASIAENIDLYNAMLTISSDLKKVAIKKPEVAKMAPKYVKLPRSYAEYNNTLFIKKCSKCHSYQSDLCLYVCLICEEIFCQGICKDVPDEPLGNFNKHSRKYHMGLGLYLHLYQPLLALVSTPLNNVEETKDVYIDNLGQSIQSVLETEIDTRKIQFKEFTINGKFEEMVKNWILNHDLPSALFKTMINAPEDEEFPADGAL